MSSFHSRFVGQTSLPKSLTQEDVDEAFSLTQEDVAELRREFTRARLGAAIQLVFIRATGRSPSADARVPRVLLQSLCRTLGLSETAIASLKTLYRRSATRFEHQRWARAHCGFTAPDPTSLLALRSALTTLAGSANAVENLVTQAELWLFGNKFLLPGDRLVRDLAREAFATQERSALDAVGRQVPARELRTAVARVFSRRRGRSGGTVLEWLRTPPAKHGPTTLLRSSRRSRS